MNAEQVIEALGLEKHVEGGFYRRTYTSNHRISVDYDGKERLAMTSIYYMLTKDSPMGHWHRNKSDILHFFHAGSPLTYWLINTDGVVEKHILGPDILKGEKLQLMVPGGYWKATELEGGEYALLSEAVTPGFEMEDMELAEAKDIESLISGFNDGNLNRLIKVSPADT